MHKKEILSDDFLKNMSPQINAKAKSLEEDEFIPMEFSKEILEGKKQVLVYLPDEQDNTL